VRVNADALREEFPPAYTASTEDTRLILNAGRQGRGHAHGVLWKVTLRALLPLVLLGQAVGALAQVSRLEVKTRGPFAGGMTFGSVGAYEKISGRLHYAVDPRDPVNARIVDLALAPQSPEGRIVFSADFILLKPADLSRGNHRLLYDVNNRGNLVALASLNDADWSNDPSTSADAGNGFLMKQGYSVLWTAWNWDVRSGDGRLQIELPIATQGGRSIAGKVSAEITVDSPTYSEPFAWGDSRGYEVLDPGDNATATLTVRDEQRAERAPIPRDRWRFGRVEGGRILPDPTHLYLESGFQPGRLYELVYVAKDPRVVGLGLAAIRDAISFFRFEPRDGHGTPNPLLTGRRPDPEKAYIFGVSQSGRVIQHMLFEGQHVDGRGRMVFDGAMPHTTGAGKGSFNHRFAQTTRHPSQHEDHQYPADFFPFTTSLQRDPTTGRTGDVLALAKRMGKIPRIIYSGTSTEYWTRAASLPHTDVRGTQDAAVHENARIYFIAGAQHFPRPTPALMAVGYQNPPNPLEHSPVLRALLVALDRWVTDGREPPPSLYPRIDRGELVPLAEFRRRFPRIPRVRLPERHLQPPRLSLGPRFETHGIIDIQPRLVREP
jgi:hypothetical protein